MEQSFTIELITPEKAREYLSKQKINRKVKGYEVTQLAQDILTDGWIFSGQTIVFDEDGRLIDGQHRLMAIIKADKAVKMGVFRGAPRESFKVLDTGAKRSAEDAMQIAGEPHGRDIGRMVRLYLTKKAGYSPTSQSSGAVLGATNRLIMAEYDKNRDFYQNLYEFAKSIKTPAPYLTIPEIGSVCAFLIKERAHSEEVVFSFFTELVQGTGHEYLYKLRNSLLRRLGSKYKKDTLNTHEKMILLSKAWNMFIGKHRKGEVRWKIDDKENWK